MGRRTGDQCELYGVPELKPRYHVTMHIGRSHHRSLAIGISVIGGFLASFTTFAITVSTKHFGSMRGQLVAGDSAGSREMPTTLNMMNAAMDGQSPILNAMGSYGFWVMVTIGAVAAGFIIFTFARRYV